MEYVFRVSVTLDKNLDYTELHQLASKILDSVHYELNNDVDFEDVSIRPIKEED